MTEYELVDAIHSITSNMIASSALFLTLISTYCVIAYTAGDKLTSYQVTFVNFVFVVSMCMAVTSGISLSGEAFYYTDALGEARGVQTIEKTVAEVIRWTTVAFRMVMAVGAVIFMWQVRHTKTD